MVQKKNHTKSSRFLADNRVFYPFKFKVLTEFMHGRGFAPEIVLNGTGLSMESLSSPDTRTSVHQLETVFSNMKKLDNDPGLALRAGQCIRISDYGFYGFALLTSTSLRRALEFAVDYHKLATPTTTMELSDDGDYACLSFENSLANEELWQFNVEFQLSLVFSLFRDIMGEGFSKHSVNLEYSKPDHAKNYEEILLCTPRFDQPRTEAILSKQLLDQPLPESNAITEAMTKEICDTLLSEQAIHSDLTRDIADLLMRDVANMPSCEVVAKELAMTSRTLRRKLEAQGTTFQAIVDSIRRDLSINFLRNTQLSIADIAEKVGFTDAANFRAAFKRWTNKTPGAIRQ